MAIPGAGRMTVSGHLAPPVALCVASRSSGRHSGFQTTGVGGSSSGRARMELVKSGTMRKNPRLSCSPNFPWSRTDCVLPSNGFLAEAARKSPEADIVE
ncbi:hypothetical protein RRG08_055548 [Elysia crispata]|uniref:Uncharacterized protein n=1 Tax=Elysia crispata TaxID=231223 RepID=A0AAE1DWX1_9GAST|nr:hypothetical protein RRG08_055548 [Elysia crispata]